MRKTTNCTVLLFGRQLYGVEIARLMVKKPKS